MAKETGKGYWRWTRLLGAALALVSIVLTGCDSDGNPFVVSLQPLYTQLELDARVVRLGVFWFLDIYPRSSKEGSDFYSVHFMRAHTIARLEIKQDSIQ